MRRLRVRAYNVLFGDAFLISIPDLDTQQSPVTRHILIDVGNVLSGPGGQATVFTPVLENVAKELQGQPLDLYVMTHMHLDHVQGLYYMSEQGGVGFEINDAWLTASAHPDYYSMKGHEDARKRATAATEAYSVIAAYLQARGAAPRYLQGILEANNPRSTEECVEFLRGLAKNTHYVHREWDPSENHAFRSAQLSIWAPEENTAAYYGRFRPVQSAVAESHENATGRPVTPKPLPGIDLGTFSNLVDRRRREIGALLAIDRAANNTSVVLCIDWNGWRLLFPGDAETRSWREMSRQAGLLKPVHMLKVGHHGSHNGTAPTEILDALLPRERPDERIRRAILSTKEDVYGGVPDDQTIDLLSNRVDEIVRTDTLQPGAFIDTFFDPDL